MFAEDSALSNDSKGRAGAERISGADRRSSVFLFRARIGAEFSLMPLAAA
jgi:hypothetical protein